MNITCIQIFVVYSLLQIKLKLGVDYIFKNLDYEIRPGLTGKLVW